MEPQSVLEELGLSKGESAVYVALLRLGEAQVNRIKIATKMHRTTIYDFLDSLIKRGLVSYVVLNGVKTYRAAPPSHLELLLHEKKTHLTEILPALALLASSEKKTLSVEICEGVEGFKTLINLILKTRQELVGFGFEEEKFEKTFPHIVKWYLKQEQKLGIKERLITRKGTPFTYPHPHMHYRYIDEQYFSPIPFYLFGTHVAFIIWEPLTIIIIENKDVAQAYRRHFELLWKIADRKP